MALVVRRQDGMVLEPQATGRVRDMLARAEDGYSPCLKPCFCSRDATSLHTARKSDAMTGRVLCAGLSGGLKLWPGSQETLRKAIDAAAVQ